MKAIDKRWLLKSLSGISWWEPSNYKKPKYTNHSYKNSLKLSHAVDSLKSWNQWTKEDSSVSLWNSESQNSCKMRAIEVMDTKATLLNYHGISKFQDYQSSTPSIANEFNKNSHMFLSNNKTSIFKEILDSFKRKTNENDDNLSKQDIEKEQNYCQKLLEKPILLK